MEDILRLYKRSIRREATKGEESFYSVYQVIFLYNTNLSGKSSVVADFREPLAMLSSIFTITPPAAPGVSAVPRDRESFL
jgi:hypothetical protein